RSLKPLLEESLPGYLLRLAYRLGRSPTRIAELCGISDGRQRRLTADHLLELPAPIATDFAQSNALSASEVHDLGLKRYASTYPALRVQRGTESTGGSRSGYFGSISDLYMAAWTVNFSSRFCPDCLVGDGSAMQDAYGGAWKLRWHLPVVFACRRHRRLLEFQCHACRRPINQSYEGRATLITQPSSSLRIHPIQCRNSILDGTGHHSHPQLCGARLDRPSRAASRLPADDRARLLALQDRLDSVLFPAKEGASTPSDGRQPRPAPFQDLIHTAQLITLSWPAARELVPSGTLAHLIDDHAAPVHAHLQKSPAGRNAQLRLLWAAPQDSAQCGALFLAAQTVFDEYPDDGALRERIRTLAQFALKNAPASACRSFFGRSDFSPALARAMARRVEGFYAAGPLEYANLRVPSRPWMVPLLVV
ncbi:TniQ family protein, partial [Streptomyces sp. NBC_00063]|uniref:TniQ family protein n=1 Tax=Streptomyces sp. NBC_00063 TaxID=2975638 RepID=UPI003D70A9F6